jgi:hypothetical protein
MAAGPSGTPAVTREQYLHLAQRAEEIMRLREDPRPWIQQHLVIRTRDSRIVPFRFNPVQADYWGRRTSRDIVLKPRQLGFTTLICGLFFADTVLQHSITSVIVAHDMDSAKRIFGIVKLFAGRLPEGQQARIGKPQYNSRHEIYWPSVNGRFYVGTAGALTFGRGQTISNLHCSEFAFWPKPEEALTAISPAVPSGGRIVIESTANGMGNFLCKFWSQTKEGVTGYTPHFYRWWQDPTYQLPGEPLQGLSEEEVHLQNAYGLSEAQLRWRRAKQQELRMRFLQEYPEDDVTCFLASGRCCFDTRALLAAQQRIAAEPEPVLLASLPDAEGGALAIAPATLAIYRAPEQGKEYVIGADIGEGLAHGDASAACVLEYESGEQVAELHGRVSPERFARLLDALGRYYGTARLGVERNQHGHSTLNTLYNTLHYPRLYQHSRYDRHDAETTTLGWPTDASTKPILVDDFAAAIAEGHLRMHSSGLVEECFSFVTTDTGSQEAGPGHHDDRVIAAAIGWQIRKRREPEVGGFLA